MGCDFRIQSTSMNCSAPEMLVALVRNAQNAGSLIPLFAASRTPAANPMVVYPIRTGSELINACFRTGFWFMNRFLRKKEATNIPPFPGNTKHFAILFADISPFHASFS